MEIKRNQETESCMDSIEESLATEMNIENGEH